MIVILKIIFICVTLVWCVVISTEKEMVFGKLGVWADAEIEKGNTIWDWLLRCSFCMPSLYSAFAYLLAYKLGMWSDFNLLWAYPIVVGGSSLAGGIIWVIFKLMVEVKQYFKYLNGVD